MALIKSIEFKGNTYEYWGVISFRQEKAVNQTFFTLGMFKDHATREANITNYADMCSNVYPGILTESQCYALRKASDMITVIITPAVAAVLDDNGNVITPAQAAVTEEQESNFFADAVDG